MQEQHLRMSWLYCNTVSEIQALQAWMNQESKRCSTNRCWTSMMSIQLYQCWRSKWVNFDPSPLCAVPKMVIPLRWTILDCDGAMKASAEGDWSSNRCTNSGGSVNNRMEQNDATVWWNNMEHNWSHYNGIVILISLCWYCTDPQVEAGMIGHLNMEGVSSKGNISRIYFSQVIRKWLFPGHEQREIPWHFLEWGHQDRHDLWV